MRKKHRRTSKADEQTAYRSERENGGVEVVAQLFWFESSVKFALYLINKFILANIARRAANG